MWLRTFDAVALRYGATKPMVSKHHTLAHDVRPCSSRTRKWERIKKLDDNTYALLDGSYGQTMWNGAQNGSPGDHAFENRMAPIVWTREADGDYIRVCNHRGSNASHSRYDFLSSYLPDGMRFNMNRNGEHWVEARVERNANGYQEFRLPKCNVQFDWNKREMTHDDGVFLKFKVNADGTFTRSGALVTVQTKRIDKEFKKTWKANLDSFYAYMAALGPLLHTDWNARREYGEQLIAWCKDNKIVGARTDWYKSVKIIPTQVARDVLTDEEHPMRVNVAAMVLAEIEGQRTIHSQDDVRSIRSAYNRTMNQLVNLYKTEEI